MFSSSSVRKVTNPYYMEEKGGGGGGGGGGLNHAKGHLHQQCVCKLYGNCVHLDGLLLSSGSLLIQLC